MGEQESTMELSGGELEASEQQKRIKIEKLRQQAKEDFRYMVSGEYAVQLPLHYILLEEKADKLGVSVKDLLDGDLLNAIGDKCLELLQKDEQIADQDTLEGYRAAVIRGALSRDKGFYYRTAFSANKEAGNLDKMREVLKHLEKSRRYASRRLMREFGDEIKRLEEAQTKPV